MSNKIDITSTALEKGIDIAKSFVEKLVNPSVEELGLLLKDQISLWRFKNQVKILSKAKKVCDENGIHTKLISPKLLCPYLENASLEDDDLVQEKWANLLVNMVDSEKNIENHVFPYILGQLSKDEFLLLEAELVSKKERVKALTEELKHFHANKQQILEKLKIELKVLSDEAERKVQGGSNRYSSDVLVLKKQIYSKEREIRAFDWKESSLQYRISAPQRISEKDFKEFELANIIRLGLAKTDYETHGGTHSIEIPSRPDEEYVSVDFDVEIDTDISVILTELGELFLEACTNVKKV